MAFDPKYQQHIPLGKSTQYSFEYDPSLLFPIARSAGRDKIGLQQNIPFSGYDRWTAFELSWLDAQGKPKVAVAEFDFAATAPNIIESKSFKLYLNSFNQTQFADESLLLQCLGEDLSAASGAEVVVRLFAVNDYPRAAHLSSYHRLDDLEVACSSYQTDANLLAVESASEKKLQRYCFDAFRSLCPVTAQPDWASVYIDFHGAKLDNASLLQYLVSYRNHQGFHEQCVEQIFMDLLHMDSTAKISVYARFLRRGGLDINPIRHNMPTPPEMTLIDRQ